MSATALTWNGETFSHTSYSPFQNAQGSPNTYFEVATGMEAIIPSADCMSNDGSLDLGVTLEISVQPCDKFRFRYKSETGSHGKIRGPAKNRQKTNFPTVKLHNWPGTHDEIEIRASLYTFEDNPKPHILELLGKNRKNDGACYEKLSDDNTAIFRTLEIKSKCKEEAINILIQKKMDICGNMCDEEEIEEIRKESVEEYKHLNMNCALLCFEALFENSPMCNKVFSVPIQNLKATCSDLKISRISSSSASCRGGDDIILLCDKINKDDIEIHFYEKDENDVMLFEANGIFNPKVDVHHQVAIAFKTPPYRDNAGGTVQMELYRKSDKQSSDPRTFTYIPDDIDALRHSKKRKFNPLESFEVQYTASSSSELMSSPSTSADFQGSPDPSSNDEDLVEIIRKMPSFQEILQNCPFVDADNFVDNLEFRTCISDPPSAPVDYDSVIMEAASGDLYPSELQEEESDEESYDWDKYYEDELCGPDTFAPQSTVAQPAHRAQPTDVRDKVTATLTSSKQGILAYIFGNQDTALDRPCSSGLGIGSVLADLASEGTSSLWNATVGRAVSYMKPSPSTNESNGKIPSHKSVPQSEMADPARKAPQYAADKIYAQSAQAHMFDSQDEIGNPAVKPQYAEEQIMNQCMEVLSIQDIYKREIPVEVVDKTVATDANSCVLRDARNGEDINKASEMNKNFESVRQGVTEIMKRRGKAVYLNYISRLMSVKDENGNSFIHLAVLEQSENLNLMARILKIAPNIANKQNKFQETPLHLATQKNAWRMVLLLLSQGGNPNIVDVNGNNCFHIASQSNYANSMKFLLFPSLKQRKCIPSINSFNYDGFSPLHLSVMNNARACMQLLIKAGADININDRTSGSSPLHLAIKQQPLLASELVSHPDIDLLNSDFNGYSIVQALCVMKGRPMPVIDRFTDVVNWAHKTLALPSQEYEESSDTDSSSNSDSDEEETNRHETEATPSCSYSGNVPSPGANGVVESDNYLSKECENRLCEFLDADGGWRKLGLFVGLDEKTLNGVLKLSKNSSPSKLVLRKVKNKDQPCDKSTMINILRAADLNNAAELLRN